LKIGLDLDGVCYQWEKTARYMLRRRIVGRGEVCPGALLQESPHWNWIEENVSQEDWAWLWSEAVKQGLFRYGHVVSGAIEGTTQLAALGEVFVVTARPKEAYGDTLAWLAFMFDKVPIAGVHFTTRKIDANADIYIDDHVDNVTPLLSSGKACVLFDRAWNRRQWPRRYGQGVAVAPFFERAATWHGVVDAVARFKERG
jgi:5'(3')-deoxyribonucleotidase